MQVRVQAGTIWDDFVKLSIENEWVGPGGSLRHSRHRRCNPRAERRRVRRWEVGEFIACKVRTWDREKNTQEHLSASADLRFGYRDSVLLLQPSTARPAMWC